MIESTEASRLAAARAGDPHAFGNLTEPYRRELQLHCYRMLGSLQDAEDMVQETLLRAWRRLDTFRRHGSFRAWLYKIATNACLDALDKRRRRALPTTAFPLTDPNAPLPAPVTDPTWLDPLPDAWLPAQSEGIENPEARYAAQESVRLAFVAALQILPPRQRAVLILRDVLDFRAREAADLLELTVPAANSLLHRARVKLTANYRPGQDEAKLPPPDDETTAALLNRYVRAWEMADVGGLVALLKEEATLAMPPWPVWYQGRAAIRAVLPREVFGGHTPGRDRLQPIRANGQPALALYRRNPDGVHTALAIQVLAVQPSAGYLAAITIFLNPSLFAAFGLPAQLEG